MRLYRNDGGFRFTDVTAHAGLDEPFYGMGISACDADGDGDTDIFVAGVGGYRLFRNDGGVFADVTVESGLDPGTWTDAEGGEHPAFATSAAFFDYDRDGRPDLFVCHYVRWSQATDVFSTMDGTTKSYATPRVYSGESSRLWRNLGGNRFEDVTDASGVRNEKGKSLCVAVVDFDQDGLPDVAVANDTQYDQLLRNNGDGTFTDRALQAGIAAGPDGLALAGMGIDGCLLPDSGRIALAVGNFSGEPLTLFEYERAGLFQNRSDVAGVALVTHHSLTFGVRFLDADLDGRTDLVLSNGHIEPTIQSVHKDISYEQSAQLLRGVPGKRFIRFRDVAEAVGEDFVRPRVARGVACADVDGDGDLDLCFTVNGGPPALLRCDLEGAAERSLRVRVLAAASEGSPAADALGARVVVRQGERAQTQWVRTGSGYLSQSELTLTFGLGDAPADSVEVTWPDGHTKSVEGPVRGSLEFRR
jgi:hypothetical protein